MAVEQHPGARSATALRGRARGTRRLGRPRPARRGRGSGAWTRYTGQPSTTVAGTTTCRGEFGERYGLRLNAAVAQRVEDPMGCRSGWRTPHYAGSPLHNPFAFDGRQQAPLGQHRAGVRCTAWMQRAGVARTARTTVGQASSSWSARCSRILLSYRMITLMTAAISAAGITSRHRPHFRLPPGRPPFCQLLSGPS